jgi:hypothetical protein
MVIAKVTWAIVTELVTVQPVVAIILLKNQG